MKNFNLMAMFALLAAAGAAGFYAYSSKNSITETGTKAPAATPTPEASLIPISDPNVKTYTLEEIAKHGGSKTYDDTQGYDSYSCWMAIHGKVYDVTEFVEPHPGGHIIEEGCGTDATKLFETRPDGSGTPHSAEARKKLERFYIGELKK